MRGAVGSVASGVELFDNPRQCWRVTGASLDVFAVPVNGAGEQVETGRYLFTTEPGEVGFGVAPCPLPDGLRRAIRTRRTSEIAACAVSPSAFGAEQAISGQMVEAMDKWLARLASCLPDDSPLDRLTKPDDHAEPVWQ